jgi:hypothetical protein
MNSYSRRSLLQIACSILPVKGLNWVHLMLGANTDNSQPPQPVGDLFPTQPPELAREMVTVAHFDLKRVKELVSARPALARAAWDWGFGDWETALGGASHMGDRPIAEYLISQGARPSLFSAAMLGQLEVVKAFVAAQPGVQRIRGPHSITLLAHAKAGGAMARNVYEFLQQLGDADEDPPPSLSEQEIASIVGTYTFGVAASQQVDVTFEQGKLTWTRKGVMGRWLVHTGDRAFYPVGAPSVRIRFAEDNGMVVMTVHDPDIVLIARRRKAAK